MKNAFETFFQALMAFVLVFVVAPAVITASFKIVFIVIDFVWSNFL